MPRVHSKNELQNVAQALSSSLMLVLHKGFLFEGRDFELLGTSTSPERTVWIQLTTEELTRYARSMGVLFATEAEYRSFVYMVKQGVNTIAEPDPWVVIKHEDGLAYMTDYGLIKVEKLGFTPNYVAHKIIEKGTDDYEDVARVFASISEWVGGDEQAHSLLYHLSTALQPGWSAVKYVLLIGEGRNGKGVLLSMLVKLLGKRNISGVFRQDMAARKAIVAELNNKLVNIIFDGPASYVSDSGPEKTFIAGEPIDIERKFENEPLTVQTNALFIESLNKEPKARDKSPALQKRLVRFSFDNVYEKDRLFEKRMTDRKSVDALLTLLWEHWVDEDKISDRLAITSKSQDLQITYDIERSPLLKWVEETMVNDPKLVNKLLSGHYVATDLAKFLGSWMATEGYEGRNATAVSELIADHFKIERRTLNHATKNYLIVLPSTARALRAMEGIAEDDTAMVSEE